MPPEKRGTTKAPLDGQSWAIQQVADRVDGKPAQESTVNIKEKRQASDWTREELMAILAKHVKKDDAQPTAPRARARSSRKRLAVDPAPRTPAPEPAQRKPGGPRIEDDRARVLLSRC